MSTIKRYNDYISSILPSGKLYDFKNKEQAVQNSIAYMMNRTQQIFQWENLPDSIPERILELYLQSNGHCCFYKYNETLYVFTGGFGGEPDVYYMPTLYTIANPALNLSKSLIINEDCIVMPNDSLYYGLLPLHERYATMLTENELTMLIAIINTRIVTLLTAPDDRTKKSAEKYLEDVEHGELGVIMENSFMEGIKAHPYQSAGTSSLSTSLIEIEQYIKATWYNELGINANFNMKRELLRESESGLNKSALLPLIDNMLRCREQAVEKVNEMFGTDISVKLSSTWEDLQEEVNDTDSERSENEGGEETVNENDVQIE